MKTAFLIFFVAIICPLPNFCSAQIVETTGAVFGASPPSSVLLGDTESNTAILAFFESRNTLQSDLVVDANSPGLYNQLSDLPTPSPAINSRTTIDSYLLHFDSIGITGVTLEGSVTFGTDILGIIIDSDALAASDSLLGSQTTAYETTELRGPELFSNDTVSLSSDRRTITVRWFTNRLVDQIRILTVTSTPEPGNINRDGIVNFSDITAFVLNLATGEFQTEADINGDDVVNFLDIGPFINLLPL